MSRHLLSMPTRSTLAVSGSSGVQELGYMLQVRRAELTETLKKKSLVYVEIKLPKGLQVFTQTVESPKLEWNRKFDFSSKRAVPIRVRLKNQLDCLGEASITVGDLEDHCQAGQDYSLALLSPGRRQLIGTLLLQLQVKEDLPRASADLVGSRQMIENMRAKIVENLNVEYPDRPCSPSTSKNAVSGGCKEPDGLEILNRVQSRLESMKSGKLKTALEVIDAAAKQILTNLTPGL